MTSHSSNHFRRTRAPRKRSPTPTGMSRIGPSPESPSSGGTPNTSTAGKPLYLSSPFADAALVKGNFKTIVMLPKYVDIMEWVAVNSTFSSPCIAKLILSFAVFDFYTNLNEFYGVISECCTQNTCPTMSAGVAYVPFRTSHLGNIPRNLNSSLNLHSLNYMWTTQGAKQVSLAAPTYIDLVMSSIQKLLEDQNVFPTKSRTTFHIICIICHAVLCY